METEKNISTSEKHNKKWLRRIWGALPALFLLTLLVFIWMLFGRIKTESEILKAEKISKLRQEHPDVNVVALELIPMPIRDRINLPGVIEPWVSLKVLTEVNGKVLKINIKEGDPVKKGDIIAILDSRDYENAFNSVKASYGAALAFLNRTKELYKEKLSTRTQLDNAVAQVEILKASLDSAALNLERCKIKAPISGVINHLFIDKGQYLNHSNDVVVILQIKRVKVKVGIPESDVDAVRRLNTFNVRIDALGGKSFSAKKYFLSKTADPMARLYNLILKLNNSTGEILPDMFARVEIVKKEVSNSISVPLYSIITRNNDKIVFVVNDNKVHSRKVELGMQEGWRVEVTKGLKAGEKIVVVGQRNVIVGQKVNVIRSVRNPEDLMK